MDDIVRLIGLICIAGWIPILAIGKAISMVVYAARCNSTESCEVNEDDKTNV